MPTFRYIGDCAAGAVEFAQPIGPSIVMPRGEAVEVPHWLAVKLRSNRFFEEIRTEATMGSLISNEEKSEPESGYGECDDCGKTLKVKNDGSLYKHECIAA